ncbi:MAG TPA: glycosyltransferase [Bacteroidetes bacterium]|nr:glycosyltransferase [Bacteroidota bacterium]
MKVLQINTTANSGSHGRIAEDIGRLVIERGGESIIAYARTVNESKSELIKIGNKLDLAFHLVKTRLFDRHGFGSYGATKALVRKIDDLDPDIIHFHNLHGYYLNIQVLFDYLKKRTKPLVWTFHDCWPFTGHCCHFEHVSCNKWKSQCFDCPLTSAYPISWFADNSRKNFQQKKELFSGMKNMILVSPSEWLARFLEKSFLSEYKIKVINNGVDIDNFKPVSSHAIKEKYKIDRKYIIGVAGTWTKNKGLGDFIKLRSILDKEIEIVLVGLTGKHMKQAGHEIKGISRTENIGELAALYSGAQAFINPTYVDNFPSVNIESLACGTPVITYKTGGSPESVDDNTGIVVEKGNIRELHNAIWEIINNSDRYSATVCRESALRNFSAKDRFEEYLELYYECLVKE